jgi:polyisoprenoid-binding protein YceI
MNSPGGEWRPVMRLRYAARTTSTGILVIGLFAAAMAAQATPAPITLGIGRVSIAGTSNVHDYKATTTIVRITRLQLASQIGANAAWDEVIKPGALEAFEIAIAAHTLKSGKDGLDKNMYKALNTAQHPDITFRLLSFQPGALAGTIKATGMLTIAGTGREVTLDLKTEPKDATLIVRGELPIVMTDYGVKPPKAMLGVIKTNPKVTVTFEIVLAPADATAGR